MNHNRNTYLLSILATLLMLLALFAVANPLSGTAAPPNLGGASATPTRFTTRTPTRTPLTASLKKALYWGGLGGHGDELYCNEAMLNDLNGLPGVLTYGRVDPEPTLRYPRPWEYVTVCVFGLPFDQGVSIELYRPDGRRAGMAEYYLGGENFEIDGWDLLPVDRDRNPANALAAYINQVPVIQFKLWAPSGLPRGEWTASLQRRRGRITPRGSACRPGRPLRWSLSTTRHASTFPRRIRLASRAVIIRSAKYLKTS